MGFKGIKTFLKFIGLVCISRQIWDLKFVLNKIGMEEKQVLAAKYGI